MRDRVFIPVPLFHYQLNLFHSTEELHQWIEIKNEQYSYNQQKCTMGTDPDIIASMGHHCIPVL